MNVFMITDVLVIVGAIAVVYGVIRGIQQLQSAIVTRRNKRFARLAQSGSIHLDLLGRLDTIEATTKQHIRNVERRLDNLEEDVEDGSEMSAVKKLAAIIVVQKQQIDALNAAHKILTRKVSRLDEEVTGNGEDTPEFADEEYAAL